MIHASYILALCISVLISYQVGFDNGKDSSNGVCRITFEVPKK